MTTQFIYVTTQREFIHSYPDAPNEVFYLRFPHRHIAHIKVMVEVKHNDREIEFIMFKHWLEKLEFNTYTSCEDMAHSIKLLIQDTYGMDRDLEITVSEDGENGATLIYRKEEVNDKDMERSRDGRYQHWYNEFIRVQ